MNELGPSSGYNLGTSNRYEPGYDWPNANEYTVELQRQLPGNLVVSGGYTRREKRNQLGQRNVAVPTNTYIPLNVVEANSQQTVTVYNQDPALRGRIDNLWDNDPEMDSTYNGGDITLNKRLSNRWMMTGGVSIGKNVGYVGAADLNNPNSKEFSRGIQGDDVPVSFRMSGLLRAPVRHFAQRVLSTPKRISGADDRVGGQQHRCAHAGHAGGHRQRSAATSGIRRLNQLDISLRKAIRMGSRVFQPRLDIYNMTNNATIRTWVTQMGNTYHRPSAIQRGTLIKMGMHIDF